MPPSASRANLQAAFASAEENTVSFLLFRLGGELYGTPLLSTREVIKHGEVKPTPYMVPHFKGVINLRGQIISVVDLRTKFEMQPGDRAQELILIVEHDQGLIGVVVDDLVSVERVSLAQIDQDALVETKIPVDFFLGIANIKERLVNMVDIAACLSSEDLRALAAG